MRYDRQGPAAEVLQAAELPDPEPGPGEVRVRVRFSGVDPGDTRTAPRLAGLPHAPPAGDPAQRRSRDLDAVGADVASSRVGRRVRVHGAQSHRPFGTAAEYTAVPEALAVDLPDAVSDEVGACPGIPASPVRELTPSEVGGVAGRTTAEPTGRSAVADRIVGRATTRWPLTCGQDACDVVRCEEVRR